MSDRHFAVITAATGEILRYGSCPETLIVAQAEGGETALECASDVTDETHYHDGLDFVPRPSFDLLQSATTFSTAQTMTISGIPVGTEVLHPGGVTIVDDGFIDWSAVEPGDYQFSFSNFPYRIEVLNAVVTAV